jgi:molybdenum cofactor guanylyltransferase
VTVTLTGLVLAGGAGRRMGRDKAVIELHGERLADRAARRLRTCCAEILVAPGSRRPLEVAGARVVADAAGHGPLAGIVGGLQAATTELLAVVGVDMPDLSPELFMAMAGRWDGEAGVVPVVDGVLQPLHALYATAWASRFAQLLAGGEGSAQRALTSLGAKVVGPDVWQPLDPDAAFARGLNSPEDLAEYPPRPPRPSPG